MSAHQTQNQTRESQAANLSLALSRVSRWLRRQHDLPLGHGAISALSTISREGPLRAGDLSSREGVAPASLSRIIAALVGEGYVERHTDPADGRSCFLSTTAGGETLLTELRSASASILLARFQRLEPGHRDTLIAAIPALEALASE